MIKVYMIIHRYFGCEKYFFDRVYKEKKWRYVSLLM